LGVLLSLSLSLSLSLAHPPVFVRQACRWGCTLLGELCDASDPRLAASMSDRLQQAYACLDAHPGDPDVACAAVTLVLKVTVPASSHGLRSRVVASGGLARVLAAMARFPGHAALQEAGCWACHNIALDPAGAQACRRAGAATQVQAARAAHGGHPGVVEAADAALREIPHWGCCGTGGCAVL
jgi:hypothetical protein